MSPIMSPKQSKPHTVCCQYTYNYNSTEELYMEEALDTISRIHDGFSKQQYAKTAVPNWLLISSLNIACHFVVMSRRVKPILFMLVIDCVIIKYWNKYLSWRHCNLTISIGLFYNCSLYGLSLSD